MPKIMTEREAERWRFERWLKGAESAIEAEVRAKGERLDERVRGRGGRFVKDTPFWWQRRRTPGG